MNKLKVLIIDNSHWMTSECLSTCFSTFDVIVAQSIDTFMSLRANGEFPDVDIIIVDPDIDYNMTEWGTYETADLLILVMEEREDVMVIAYTNNLDPHCMQCFINFGIDGWYTKGKTLPADLSKTIQSYITE